MSWLLATALLLIFTVGSYRRPLAGAAIIIALLPIYQWRLSFLGWPTTFLELMIWFLFLIWLIKDKKYKLINLSLASPANNPVPLFWRWLLIAWLLFSMVAVLVNPTLAALGLWRAYFLEPVMFFLVLIYELKNPGYFKYLWSGLAFLLLGLTAVTIFQYYTGWHLSAAYDGPNHRRLTGIFPYPNALALLVAPLASFFLGLWLTVKKKFRQIYFLLFFFLGAILSFLAKSEGAVLGLGLSFIFCLILAKKIRKIGQPLVIVIVLFLLISGQGWFRLQSLGQQIFQPQLDLQATSLEIRSSQWQEDWLFLQDHFIFGAGIGGYQKALAPYHRLDWLEIYLYPHNIFLNFWTELGFLGLLIFILILIKIVFTLGDLHRQGSPWSWALTLFWSTWFLHGLVDVPYFKNDLSILFFLFLAITIASQKMLKTSGA